MIKLHIILFLFLFQFLVINGFTYNIAIRESIVEDIGSCKCYFSVSLDTAFLINDTDFYYQNNNMESGLVMREGTKQTFLFTIYQTVTLPSEIFNITVDLNPSTPIFPQESFVVGDFLCNSPQPEQLNISRAGDLIYEKSLGGLVQAIYLNLDPNTPINPQKISSVIPSPLFGFFQQSQAEKNMFILIMPFKYTYNSLPDEMLVQFKYLNITFNHTVDLSSVQKNRTSVITNIEIYPPAGSTIVQQSPLSASSVSYYISVKNLNSFFFSSTGMISFKPIQDNGTDAIIHGSGYAFFSGDSVNQIYMADKSSTIVPYSYNLTYQGFDNSKIGIDSYNLYFDEELNLNLVYISMMSNVVDKFKISVQFGFKSFEIENWIPSSFNSSTQSYLYTMTMGYGTLYKEMNIFASLSPVVSSIFINATNTTLTLEDTVIVHSISYKIASPNTYIARVNISSSYPISKIAYPVNTMYEKTLIYGDEYNGVYEMEIQPSDPNNYVIDIYTENQIIKTLRSGLPYNVNGDILQKMPPSNVKGDLYNEINYFEFSKNNIDLTSGPVSLKLFLNFSVEYVSLKPEILLTMYANPVFIGSYNKSLQLYVFDIEIPPTIFVGNLYYVFKVHGLLFTSYALQSIIGNNVSLNISKSNGGIATPLIMDVVSNPGNNVTVQENESITIGWNLTIKALNGIKNVTVDVVSEIDLQPTVITFDTLNLVSGDKFFGVYAISLPINGKCKTQTYSLRNFIFNGQPVDTGITQDPLTPISGTPKEKQMYIKVNCNTNLVDDIAPFISNLTMTPTVNVGTQDRSVEFYLTTYDNNGGSGISEKHNPVIILMSGNGDNVKFTTNFVKSSNGTYEYYLKEQLPFGFGLNSILVTVTGIIDNFINFRSYQPLDLKNAGFPYYIKRTQTLDNPIIDTFNTDIDYTGGSITITGKSFGVDSKSFVSEIDYEDGKGYQSIQADLHSGILLQYNRIPAIKSKQIKFRVSNNQVYSNELTISVYQPPLVPTQSPNVTTTPSSTPQKCLGTPECNNHGTCINSICQCNLPWYGPSCSSQIFINPPPTPNSEPSIGTNASETNAKVLRTSIEIIGIRELDASLEVVEFFNISSWNFTDQTISNISNPKFHYSTLLKSRSTVLNVTIEYFRNTTNFTFADEELLLPASTIKFTMNLNSYSFKSSTNLIQILMKSTIETDQSNVCSSIGVGNEDGSVQWIKLNIDDRSLYGRFLSKGIIDNVVRPIQNLVIEDDKSEQTKQFRSATVGITVPKYDGTVLIDPDFSNLVDVNSKDTTSEICSSSKKLSNGAIAGIVVGSIVFISVVSAGIILFIKKRNYEKASKKMQQKLSTFDSSHK